MLLPSLNQFQPWVEAVSALVYKEGLCDVFLVSCIRLFIARVMRDGLLKSASALTYQSFLAIVPLLAVLFGIAKGFGLGAGP